MDDKKDGKMGMKMDDKKYGKMGMKMDDKKMGGLGDMKMKMYKKMGGLGGFGSMKMKKYKKMGGLGGFGSAEGSSELDGSDEAFGAGARLSGDENQMASVEAQMSDEG